jgi:uncharacterized protein
MPTAKASVPTANAAKYMQQLCKHWSHKLEVDLSEQRGVVKFRPQSPRSSRGLMR